MKRLPAVLSFLLVTGCLTPGQHGGIPFERHEVLEFLAAEVNIRKDGVETPIAIFAALSVADFTNTNLSKQAWQCAESIDTRCGPLSHTPAHERALYQYALAMHLALRNGPPVVRERFESLIRCTTMDAELAGEPLSVCADWLGSTALQVFHPELKGLVNPDALRTRVAESLLCTNRDDVARMTLAAWSDTALNDKSPDASYARWLNECAWEGIWAREDRWDILILNSLVVMSPAADPRWRRTWASKVLLPASTPWGCRKERRRVGSEQIEPFSPDDMARTTAGVLLSIIVLDGGWVFHARYLQLTAGNPRNARPSRNQAGGR